MILCQERLGVEVYLEYNAKRLQCRNILKGLLSGNLLKTKFHIAFIHAILLTILYAYFSTEVEITSRQTFLLIDAGFVPDEQWCSFIGGQD